MKKNIVIFGGGSHCLCVLDIIESTENFNVIGIIDSLASIGSEISGYKVIGRQNQLLKLSFEVEIEEGEQLNLPSATNRNCVAIPHPIPGRKPEIVHYLNVQSWHLRGRSDW